MEAPTTPFVWNGEAMVPPPGFARRCDEIFVIGQRYVLTEVQERSSASHRHFFACVRETWMNLPEEEAQRFRSPDMLRKHALIRAGFCDVQETVCKFKTEANRLAATIQATAAMMDDYVIVTVRGKVVTSYRAKSMDMRSMDKATFQEAKDRILAILGEMLGVDPTALASRAEAA
jgi:hypothetical protein